MTKTLTLLVASTALTVAVGLPAWSAMHVPAQSGSVSPLEVVFSAADQNPLLILIDDDDDENEGGGSVSRRQSDDDEDDDECEDDEGSCGASSATPAPAGSVAPPQNGLFGSGTPQVQVK
jgi:hypothetical protein